MEIRKRVCDVKDCKREDATLFSFFKDRRPDGAGSMENWNYSFDLCPLHQKEVLQTLLDTFGITEQQLKLVKLLENFKIKASES